MDRCIHKYRYNYITVNDILTPLRSGFRHEESTTNQLLHTYHTICEAVDKGKEVRAVFCDISKAFDRVWYKGLLFKLRTIGCSDSIVNWFLSYLSNRRQRVVINGQASDRASVFAGVPQGSFLSPLLFLIFINPLSNTFKLGALFDYSLTTLACILLWTAHFKQDNFKAGISMSFRYGQIVGL